MKCYSLQEQKILRLQEEINRLSLYEGESMRKEHTISQLREEIADLQNKLRQAQITQPMTPQPMMISGGLDPDLLQKYLTLQNDMEGRRHEIQQLKDLVSSLQHYII